MGKVVKAIIVLGIIGSMILMINLFSSTCVEFEGDKCIKHVRGYEQFQAFMENLMGSYWIWLLAIAPLVLLGLYYLGEYLNIKGKLKAGRMFDTNKRIKQEDRWRIGEDFIDEKWKIRASGKLLIMVNNYITQERDDTRPHELMLFTTSRSYADNRKSEESIPPEQCFYVVVDCISGERFSMDFMRKLKFRGAVQYMNRYWLMSIKEKVETPIEMWMKKSMAEAMGTDLIRKDTSTDKEEVKDEKS